MDLEFSVLELPELCSTNSCGPDQLLLKVLLFLVFVIIQVLNAVVDCEGLQKNIMVIINARFGLLENLVTQIFEIDFEPVANDLPVLGQAKIYCRSSDNF